MNYFPTGTVYGTLLNFRAELEALGDQVNRPPYKAAPKAPVLYVKPANTWSAHEAEIPVPPRVSEVEVGATIAMVMKAPGEVAGYVLMNDLSISHASLFRPPIKFKCLDGFLGVGGTLLPRDQAGDPSKFVLEVRINGELKQTVKFDQLIRGAEQLLADVGEFMTLGAGDVLMLGCDVLNEGGRPLAKVGDRIELSARGLGILANTLVAEAA
jgi:5-oxopent-3-ene-1,2,5-tricarboxylate decarboxylase/2-hydroxyhepta-2,4-diene-1,7-dioate isomerase